jgi:hypothetical protein
MFARRLLPVAAAVAALAWSGSSLAADPAASLPAGWSHAQVNVVGPGRKAHTLIFDRGRVQSVVGAALALLERDGSVVTIQVAPNAVVRLNGRRASLADLRPGDTARTRGIDGGPADSVVATRPFRPLRPGRKLR